MNTLPAAARSKRRLAPAVLMAASAAALAACVPGTVGPSVRAVPGPNKTVAEFGVDNNICTVSARVTARSQLLANGGLDANAQAMQQILDNAYTQCMINRGDLVPGVVANDTSDSYDALVRAVQSELRRTGFSSGSVDGVYGPMTRSAILSFERSNGMAADPDVTQSLLASLRAAPDGRAPVASSSSRAKPVTAVKAPSADALVQPVSSPPTASAPGAAAPAAPAPAPAPAPGGLVAPTTSGVGE
jgi:peptidoglycan hydrolase-like protein with peptidoglycan-binding domain